MATTDECAAVLAERARCAAIVRAKKPPEPRLWWIAVELELLAEEIERKIDGREAGARK